MERKTIQAIKDAELKAQQVVRDAEAEKEALLKKAREDGAAYKENLKSRAAAQAKAAIDAIEMTRDDVMEKAGTRAEAVIAGFSGNISGKKEAAVEAVISELA